MKIEEYTKEYILADVEKLQYLYKLKEVIRYNQDREGLDVTESVAEHLYGMQLLSQYFLPLEDPEGKLDRARIYELITIHDFDEIETGDYLSHIKTPEHQKISEEALPKVLDRVPEHINATIRKLADEYETQSSPEARFTKAIDKIEPFVQILNDYGGWLCRRNKVTAEDSLRIKRPYIDDYPFIEKFTLVLNQEMKDRGYYWTGD